MRLGSQINIGEAASSEIYIDPVLHERILRKLDMRLGPLFCLLFLSSYLDRSNIGNAAVAGLNTQLGLSGSQYSTAVSVFFATYVAFMVPSVLLLRKFKPHRCIAIMAGAWSIVTIGTAFVRSYSSLLAARLILGFCESGFFPCISLYLTMVYNREEQGLRFAYLFAATAFSGMFGGLIATGITHISTNNGIQSWSWLYIIEGLVSLIVVPWAWYGLPAYPAHANWWTPEERATMEARELKRREYMGTEKFEWEQARSVLKEWRVYTGALIQFFQDVILYGFSTFLPSILHNGLGYTTLQAQYLSVPVYLLGGISFFTAAKIGDKWGLRGTCLLVLDVFAVVGYVILIGVESNAFRYFACYLIALPLYCGPGLNETWIVNNTAPHYRRATAQGISQAVGNLAGFVAPQVYRSAPYLLGHWSSLASALICMALISVQIVHYKIQNRRKEQIASGEREDDRKGTVGEDNIEFRYVY
ncbi:high-affinity nicotinic acid transporter [Xylaria digitata]|nr:high-affinity nicotinic acid transporter [Xylaria digitata]